MGGGDLNLKKSWHPGTFKNQEIVWKKEQKLIEEKKKLAQLRKELEDERDQEHLQGLQRKKNKNARLEWMYSAGPNTSQDIIAQEKEDYLLGNKRIDKIQKEEETKEHMQAYFKGTSSIYGIQANTAKDFQSKVRDDPLLMFKKQEQAALELMLKNPIKIKEITKKKKVKKNKKERSRDRSISPRGSSASPRLRPLKQERSRSPRVCSTNGERSPSYRYNRPRRDECEYSRNEHRSDSHKIDHRSSSQYHRRDSLSSKQNNRQETRNQRLDSPKQDIEEKLAEMKRNAAIFKQQRAQRIESETKEELDLDYSQSNNFLSKLHKDSLKSRH